MKTFTSAWMSGVALGVLAFAAAPALAQQASPPQPATQTPSVAVASAAQTEADAGQNADAAQDADAAQVEDVVVTGTLLRGVAPTGTNVVGVSAEEIVETGVANSADLLARVPQISNAFNTAPQPGALLTGNTTRPNIRNLGASGGSTTLVLVNGNRIVGAGILQTSPDPASIPPSVLQSVEVIPDGGSSIYGSDAIGGVINFITRKRYDGLMVNGKYGFGSGYDTYDLNLLAGRDWGSGSIVFGAAYTEHSNIIGSDRDYFTQNNLGQGGTDFRVRNCQPGNVTTGGVTYALPGGAVGVNLCDEADVIDFYPEEQRSSVYLALTQTLSDRLTFDVATYYSERETRRIGQSVGDGTGLRGSGTITSSNPYFRSFGAGGPQTVAFSYDSVVPDGHFVNPSEFTSLSFVPTLTYDIGGGWQARLTGNYGKSTNVISARQPDAVRQAAALAGTTVGTALNPYNVGATDRAVLDAILDFQVYGSSDQEIKSVRFVTDGPLGDFGAGEIKLALGGEYYEEKVDAQQGQGSFAAPTLFRSVASRDVSSLFAELFVPLLDESPIGSFDLSASARYDDYSDVGDTINPKIGFNYKPIPDLRIRGNFGTSFHAPSLQDTGAAVDSRAQVRLTTNNRAPGSPASDQLRPNILIAGGNANIKPEEADTWSLGADWTPSGALDGLEVNLTYFNVNFTDVIGLVPFGSTQLYTDPSYAGYFWLNPTLAQAQTILAGLRVENAPSIESLYTATSSPYVIIDARRNNLGVLKVDGVDFNVAYRWRTDMGEFNASLAGTYTLNRDQQSLAGAPVSDQLAFNTSQYSLVGRAGWRSGPAALSATINYSDGYKVQNVFNQTEVDGYTTINLFGSYDFEGSSWAEGLTLTANIDNLLDEDPPYSNTTGGTANGSTLGRVFSIGLRKEF